VATDTDAVTTPAAEHPMVINGEPSNAALRTGTRGGVLLILGLILGTLRIAVLVTTITGSAH
jgi:hypothetical protein